MLSILESDTSMTDLGNSCSGAYRLIWNNYIQLLNYKTSSSTGICSYSPFSALVYIKLDLEGWGLDTIFMKKLFEVVQLLSIETVHLLTVLALVYWKFLQHSIRHHILKMLLHKCKTTIYEIAQKPIHFRRLQLINFSLLWNWNCTLNRLYCCWCATNVC